MAMQIRAARAYYMYIASMFDHPELYGKTNSTPQVGKAGSSKVFSTSTAIEIMLGCMELMGSYGYCAGYDVEKYLRDVIIIHLWMGGVQLTTLESAQAEYPFEPW
jgi:alkylation response protein AidB-like acyl-CoA dehydrogenase